MDSQKLEEEYLENFEPDLEILKQKLDATQSQVLFHKKQATKYAAIEFLFFALGLTLAGITKNTTLFHLSQSFSNLLVNIPFLTGFVTMSGTMIESKQYMMYNKKFNFYIRNFYDIKAQQILLANDELVEEVEKEIHSKKETIGEKFSCKIIEKVMQRKLNKQHKSPEKDSDLEK